MKNKNDMKKNRNVPMSILLFVLYMNDYLLTYIGINKFGIIEERNPFLQRFFSLPIGASLAIRLIFAVIIIGSLRFLFIKQSRYYKPVMLFALISYGLVNVAHIRWIVFILIKS